MGELNHRLDVLLALARLDSGIVLDPTNQVDQAELRQRRSYALETLIDETLLTEAAARVGLRPDASAIDQEMAHLTAQAGGDELLADLER